MMLEIVPFVQKHLKELSLQPAQQWMQELVDTPSYGRAIERADSYTAFIDGEIVAVGFLTEVWPGRAHLSALVSSKLGPGRMVALHREVKRRLDASPIRRIEACVDDMFLPGHRWLLMLGFRRETPDGMPGYLPDGRRGFLYARVKT